MKTELDIWAEMSIREIGAQCHFAEIAYSHINQKSRAGTDLVFSSIHSFLSHCALVSKMLKAKKEHNPLSGNYVLRVGNISLSLQIFSRNSSPSIGKVLGITDNSPIHKRKFRNSIEHYDNELKKWIKKYPLTTSIGTYNIGSKNAFSGKAPLYVSHYDPGSDTFTFVNQDINLGELMEEVLRIKTISNNWVATMRAGQIEPPFIK